MREQPDFSERFEEVITSDEALGAMKRIDRRLCSSDEHEGAEYEVYGWYIPVRPILQSVRELDDFAIQSMAFNNEQDEPCLQFFLADLRGAHDDAAFTEE